MGLYWFLLASYCLAIIGLLYLKRSAIKVGFKTGAFALLCAAANQIPKLAPFLAPLIILLAAIDGAWAGALVALAGGLAGALTGKLPWVSAAGEVLFGSLLGFFLTLDYSDRLPRHLRKPEVASVLASLVAWPTPLSFALALVPELFLKGDLLYLGKFFSPLPAIFLGALLFRFSPLYRPPPIRSGNPSPMARSTAMAFVSWFLALYLLIFLISTAILTFVRTKSELETTYDGLRQTLASVSLSIQQAEKLADYILSLSAEERKRAIAFLCPSSCSIIRLGDSLEALPYEEKEALAHSWPLSRPYYFKQNWLFTVIRTQGPEKLLIRVAMEKPNLCFVGKEPEVLLCPAGVSEEFEDKIVLKGENALAFAHVSEIIGRVNRFIALFALAQLLILLSIVVVALILTTKLIQPLEELSLRAVRLASGNLDENLSLARDDEVGKLARALEKMRQYLRQRVDESYALLRVSQRALSEPDLERGIEILLLGLRDLTKAAGAAFVILDKNGLVSDCVALGRIWQEVKGNPPSACSRLLAIQGEPVVIPFAREAPIILREALQEVGARSVIGIPLQNGLLWFTFSHPLQVSSSELSLINAIAGQLDVMAENLKLLKSLEKQKAYLETILRSTLDPILVVDELGRLVTLNPAAEEALGLKGKSSLGLPLIEKLREQPWREFMEQLRKAKVPFQAEIPSPQGVTFHVKAYPLMVDGNFRGWVIAMRDITPLKEAERSRAEALEIAFHDLYTPLTLIRDYAKTLEELGGLNEKQREIAEKLVRNAEHSSRLVRNFLDISRMEAGRMKLAPCWLGPLVEEAIAEVAERAKEKGLSLEVHLEEAYPFIGDREFVKRAIVNLLDNAVKYTPAPGKITVSVDDAGRFWVLRVQDTGIGIPYSEQPRIFEKFFRGKEAEALGIRGSGLGLALVKAVAEKHRGKVWVESVPGKGSTFFLAIPKAQRTEPLEGR